MKKPALTYNMIIAIFMLLFVMLSPAGEAQAVMFKMSLEELVAEADSIVIGTVESSVSSWNDDYTSIYTTVVVFVEDELKKDSKQDTITIIVPGGEVGGITQLVSDTPAFEEGEKAVMFLSELPGQILPRRQVQPKFYALEGNFQGKLEILDEKAAGMPIEVFEENLSAIIADEQVEMNFDFDPDEPEVVSYYQFVPIGIRWPNSAIPVSYRVNASSARNSQIQSAANTWSNAGANFSMRYAGTHSRSGNASRNFVNEVMWSSLGANNALAVATIWFSGSTILEADMTFNTKYDGYWSTTGTGGYDVQTVALHEFGHWVGLDHSPLYASIMYYRIKGTQRYLDPSDIAGIRHIYGTSDGGGSSGPVAANDNFTNRITLSGLSGQVTASNINASKELGEPNHAGRNGGHSLWWEWVAPVNGSVEFNTYGSNFDTVLAVYLGSSLSSLSLVAANDDYGGTYQSRVAFNVTAGTSYKIAVDGWSSTSTGSILLNWQAVQAACVISTPQLPTGLATGFTGNTYEFTTGQASCSNNHSVQYRFDWGDGTYSNWSSSTTATKIWQNAGNYQVRTQARCSTETSRISSWSESKSIAITVEEKQFNLSISTEGQGTTNPETGVYEYTEGNNVDLSAIPASGWLFDRWEINTAVYTDAAITITVTANTQAKAIFRDETADDPEDDFGDIPGDLPDDQFSLTINVVGEGAVEPEMGTYPYQRGSEVQLNAVPSEGWEFRKWVVNADEFSSYTIAILMTEEISATAIFTEIESDIVLPPVQQYSLAIEIIGQGSVSPAQGTHYFDESSTVEISATASSGWSFEKWLINDQIFSSASRSITMDRNIDATAVFKELPTDDSNPPQSNPGPQTPNPTPPAPSSPPAPVQHGLTIAVSGEGTADPAPGSHKYDDGLSVSVAAKPGAGWRFVKWVIDGQTVTLINTTIEMSGDKTATAYYEKVEQGDITGDGTITVQDVVVVARHSLGLAKLTETQLASADVNGDGKVDVRDITLIMQYALGLIDKFPGR